MSRIKTSFMLGLDNDRTEHGVVKLDAAIAVLAIHAVELVFRYMVGHPQRPEVA